VHGLWLFQMAQLAAQTLPGEAAQNLAALLQRTGGQGVMALTMPRQMERRNNVLVLK